MTPEPGIYLNLPEDEYFKADALGYSDLKRLAQDPYDWWAGSRFNPHSFEADAKGYTNDVRTLGKATHTVLLEGIAAYNQQYTVKYQKEDAPSKFDINAMRGALKLKGIETDVFITAPEAKKLCRDNKVRLLEDLMATYDMEVRSGKTPLAFANHKKVLDIHAGLESQQIIEDLQGKGLIEVSVFWEQDGVMMRARFDSLLPRFLCDLKTNTPSWNASDFASSSLWDVATYGYDVQAEHYSQGRKIAADLLKAKKVFGGTKAERALLKKMLDVPFDATGENGWTWLWLFLQPPSNERGRGRALKLLPILPFMNPDWPRIASRARDKIATAIAGYKACTERFGLDTPWTDIAEPWVPTIYDYPKKLTGVYDND